MEKTEDIILEIEDYVFVVRGERCNNCKEEFPYEEESERVLQVSRKFY